ncbi:response regulator transcription factor [Saccharopolyspora elongata]
MKVSQLRRIRLRLNGNRSRFNPRHLRYVTPAEELIILGVASGCRNSEIADSLGICTSSVKTHVKNILAKFDLRGRAEIVVVAYEVGLVVPGWVASAEFVRKPQVGREYYPSEVSPKERPLVPLRP